NSLACHEHIRLIDRIDFLHCHIELKSQFDQVPSRIIHLPAWNQYGAIPFSCGGTNLIGDAAHRADLPPWFNGSGQGNAPLNMLSLEQGDESHGHRCTRAWSVA